MTKYAKIQQLYPKSSISKHRVIFWYDSLIKLQNDLTIDSIKSIRDCHESIIQSEDSSVEGTRARIIKAKSGYLASAIEEPREGLRSKLIELKKRSMDETRSFKDEATCRKTLELSFDEVLTDHIDSLYSKLPEKHQNGGDGSNLCL